MKLIQQEKFNKIIEENFDYTFNNKEEGIYLIEIIASCKSWKQNLIKFISFFKDDDLTIKINKKEFPKLNGKRGLFDGEVAWNGNNLKGLSKTNVFAVRLDKGNHKIHFLVNQKPFLKSIKISMVENLEKIIYIPAENNPAEDGNRRQWINFTLVDLPVKRLNIQATAKTYKGEDDDDIKLIIDGEIQKNAEDKSHKNWYWCGRTSKGVEKEFNKKLRLKQGLNYIELWADRKPFLHKVEMELRKIKKKEPKKEKEEKSEITIQKYTYKGISKKENYNRFDEEIKYAVDYWNNIFSKQEYPPTKLLDYNLVKAIVYKESRIGYFKVEEGAHPSYPDVMQVAYYKNPALPALQGAVANEFISKNQKKAHLSYNFPKERLPIKVEAPKESIFWGVRWLYHKAQKSYGTGENYNNPPLIREWKTWKQAVIDYNGSEKKYEYQKTIWRICKNGISPFGKSLWEKYNNGFSLIKSLIIIVSLTVLCLTYPFLTNHKVTAKDKIYPQATISNELPKISKYGNFDSQDEATDFVSNIFLQGLEEYKKIRPSYINVFQEVADECEKNNCAIEYVILNYYDDLIKHMKNNEQFLEAVRPFDFFKGIETVGIEVRDIDNDGENELIFIEKDILNSDYIKLIIVDKINGKFQIVEQKIEDMVYGRIDTMDLTGDLRPEIVLFAQNHRWGERLFIYQYLDNKIIKLLFKHSATIYPIYTFSDTNKNNKVEIKIEGRQFDINPIGPDCSACNHTKVEEIYEYQPADNNFILVDKKYFGISGALYNTLQKIIKQGMSHKIFANWSIEDKQNFSYIIQNLKRYGTQSLFSNVRESSLKNWTLVEKKETNEIEEVSYI